MAKIMLVEDDNNLREIYEARLLAEGYEIVAARDGEEALALAVKEKPDLIISDVMMPKISGFDMLDILRSTPETKDTKIIMMTALSQAEDKARADKLGADRYLVKSQVTLEDVAKVAHDVLTGEETAGPALSETPGTTTPAADSTPITPDPVAVAEPVAAAPAEPVTTPVEPVAEPAPVADPAPEPVSEPTPVTVTTPDEPAATTAPAADTTTAISDDLTQTTSAEEAAIESQINEALAATPETPVAVELATTESAAPGPVAEQPATPAPTEAPAESAAAPATEPVAEPAPETPPVIEPTEPKPEAPAPAAQPEPATGGDKRVIQPINDITAKPDLDALLKQEENKEATAAVVASVLDPANAKDEPITPPPAPGTSISPNDISL